MKVLFLRSTIEGQVAIGAISWTSGSDFQFGAPSDRESLDVLLGGRDPKDLSDYEIYQALSNAPTVYDGRYLRAMVEMGFVEEPADGIFAVIPKEWDKEIMR